MTEKPLEDLLRQRAKSGRLNYLSIAFTDAGWEVTYRGVEDKDFRHFTHHDIACGLRGALTGRAGVEPKPGSRTRVTMAAKDRIVSKIEALVQEDDIFGDL